MWKCQCGWLNDLSSYCQGCACAHPRIARMSDRLTTLTTLTTENENLRARVGALEAQFRHYHEAGNECCTLGIRDSIHIERALDTGGEGGA